MSLGGFGPSLWDRSFAKILEDVISNANSLTGACYENDILSRFFSALFF